MEADIDAVGRMLAEYQARIEAALDRADSPGLRAQVQSALDDFKAHSAGFLAAARTKAAATAAKVAAYEAAPPALFPVTPPEPAQADELEECFRAGWFGQFGNREYPPEPG